MEVSDPEMVQPESLAEYGGPHRGQLCIGGVSMQVASSRNADVIFDQELEPFRVQLGVSDIDIHVGWVDEIPETPGRILFDSGTTWRLSEREAAFQFDFGDPIGEGRTYKRLLMDQWFRRATLQMCTKYFAEYFTDFPEAAGPLAYPLDELLIVHRLTQERAVELHGCGIVGPNGTANLFVGHSGAGKSTTTRLWTDQHDVQILSDDRIIVREDGSKIFMYGTPWHGEAHFALPSRAPLQRVLVLEHGQGNVLTRLSPGQAVAELFARSFVPFYRHEYIDSALAFLQYVASSIPCYRYSFEPDARAVERILTFRD